MIYSSEEIGIGKIAPDSLLEMSGANLIITSSKFPIRLIRKHVADGAILLYAQDEPPLFEYGNVIEQLQKMQRLGASFQQCILAVGVDEHSDLKRALYTDYARAWRAYGGSVEWYIKGGLYSAVQWMEKLVPAPTAEMQCATSFPGVDYHNVSDLLGHYDGNLTMLILALAENKQDEFMGISTSDVRRFLGLKDEQRIYQV